jgi:WD40 repeat protein
LRTVIDEGATDLKALDLSSDGKRCVTTNGSGAKIWETSTGKLLRSIPNDNFGRKHSAPDVSSQYTSHVWSVQFSPDEKQLAMGDTLGVKLLDVITGKLSRELAGPYRYSSSPSPGLVFSKDGQRLARLGTQEPVLVRQTIPVRRTGSPSYRSGSRFRASLEWGQAPLRRAGLVHSNRNETV